MVLAALSCEKSGRIVVPAWPPITGMEMSPTGAPVISCTNFSARTQSSVVTPTILHGSCPAFFHSSHMAGTTELTGLTMSAMTASGQNLAHASTMFFAMPALISRSAARSCPGLRGTPAGTSTRSHPVRHSPATSAARASLSKAYALTLAALFRWLRSAATPSAGIIAIVRSYTHSSATFGSIAMSIESGCPMPPAPPTTQTL
mmetsp:Transcript_3597/g.11921  ORF Transcript_3597/g.11921 Transcript_3597/m.11921 type:complete len:203 (+) Transcript_3597:336-944(+)